MRQFKLIKEYPNSPKLGCKIHLSCNNYEYGSYRFNRESIENNPEYWEEIIDYPIGTKVKSNQYKDWIYEKISDNSWKEINCSIYTNIENEQIGYGKRFQVVKEQPKPFLITEDGHEKQIGDKAYPIYQEGDGKWRLSMYSSVLITTYWLNSVTYRKDFHTLEAANEWIKKHNPLFVTEDGVKIYENTDYYTINTLCKDWYENNIWEVNTNAVDKSYKYSHMKCFSTKAAAEKWIDKNKVQFTTEDGIKITKSYDKSLWYINLNFKISPCLSVNYWNNNQFTLVPEELKKGYKYFSTEEAANQYIIGNKPCLSLNDIKAILEQIRCVGNISLFKNKIEEKLGKLD